MILGIYMTSGREGIGGILGESEVKKLCPKCKTEIYLVVVKLAEGGFLYKEICPKNETHYKIYREPTYDEMDEMSR